MGLLPETRGRLNNAPSHLQTLKINTMTYDTELFRRSDNEANKIISDLKDVIARYKKLSFTPEAIKLGYVPDADVVGCLISQYFDYDPEQIFEASRSAFEDLNYHSFNEELQKIWHKELSKSDETYNK
jgi:hypothetical protein